MKSIKPPHDELCEWNLYSFGWNYFNEAPETRFLAHFFGKFIPVSRILIRSAHASPKHASRAEKNIQSPAQKNPTGNPMNQSRMNQIMELTTLDIESKCDIEKC